MNWKALIPVLIIVAGIYALWTWLSRSEANPTTQEAFKLNPSLRTDQGTMPIPEIVGNEIPEIVPDKSLTYDTVYNIVVEAPVIPKLDSSQIMDDLVIAVEQAEKAPISQPTGGEDQLIVTHISPSGGKTYSTPKAIAEKTVTPIYDPIEMVTDTARPIGSFGGR